MCSVRWRGPQRGVWRAQGFQLSHLFGSRRVEFGRSSVRVRPGVVFGSHGRARFLRRRGEHVRHVRFRLGSPAPEPRSFGRAPTSAVLRVSVPGRRGRSAKGVFGPRKVRVRDLHLRPGHGQGILDQRYDCGHTDLRQVRRGLRRAHVHAQGRDLARAHLGLGGSHAPAHDSSVSNLELRLVL